MNMTLYCIDNEKRSQRETQRDRERASESERKKMRIFKHACPGAVVTRGTDTLPSSPQKFQKEATCCRRRRKPQHNWSAFKEGQHWPWLSQEPCQRACLSHSLTHTHTSASAHTQSNRERWSHSSIPEGDTTKEELCGLS